MVYVKDAFDKKVSKQIGKTVLFPVDEMKIAAGRKPGDYNSVTAG